MKMVMEVGRSNEEDEVQGVRDDTERFHAKNGKCVFCFGTSNKIK